MLDFLTPQILAWSIFSIFLLSAFFFYVQIRYEDGRYEFHVIAFLMSMISVLAYLSYGTGQGIPPSDMPQILWPRKYELMITTPLMVLAIGLLVRAPKHSLFGLVGNAFFSVVAFGLGSTVIKSSKRYGWWFMGVCLTFLLFAQLRGQVAKAVHTQTAGIAQLVRTLTGMAFFVLLVTPVVWIIGHEGMGMFGLRTQMIVMFLGDFTQKVIFCGKMVSNRALLQEVGRSGKF